jgi:signal transduction histidine kinase/CheY-like chemotaxis protein
VNVGGETILLVEDNQENREFMVDYVLAPNGYQSLMATNGQQGLDMALTHSPDLIILDFKLPELSGIDVLSALRERQVDIPVIFITAYGSEEDIVSGFRLGIKDYFRKPFDIDRMLTTIRDVLNEKQEQEQQSSQQRDLEQYIKELGTLYGSGQEHILNRTVEIATAITGAEEGYLLLVDSQTDELYMRSALNLGERFAREFRIKIKDSIAGRVVRTGEPVCFNYLDESDRFKVKTGYLVKALINVPLRSHGKTIGVLGVNNQLAPKTFAQADQDILVLLAEHAATAIENASLYGQTHKDLIRQVQEFVAMQQVARDLNAIMDLDRIARLLLQHALRMTPAETGLIGLTVVDPQPADPTQRQTHWAAQGYLNAAIENQIWQPDWDAGLIGEVVHGGRPVLINDTQPHHPHSLSRSRLIIPILRGGRVRGVIDVESSKPDVFTESNQRFLSTLSDHAAVAIENARLFDLVLDEQTRTKFILQSIADGVYTVDRDLRILTFNPAAERITGWRGDALRGKPLSEVFLDQNGQHRDSPGGSQSSSHQVALVRQVLETGETLNSGPDAPAILTTGGEHVFISSSASPLRARPRPGRENAIVGAVVAFRDVSAERELDRLKSDFVSMVSHELRAPLANLTAAIELLLDSEKSGNLSGNTLHIARTNAQRLNHLIENILNVSHIEAGQMGIQIEPVTLLPLVSHAIGMTQAQTDRHRITLRAPEMVPFVLADRSKLAIVLDNLLANAVLYSPNGGRILVRIAPHEVRSEIVVSVIDEGIGIPEEHMDKLFTRFYRVDASDGREVYGHGLGLYISKNLVELQGGHIWVRSKEGQGSCFSFSLPTLADEIPETDPDYTPPFED